jgi:arginyl-tRNA synthetase
VTKLQAGDEESLRAWARICDASRQEFAKIYDRLGVSLEERGESFYNPKLPAVVEELAQAGILEESDGAKVVFTERMDGVPPLMVQKRDGGFGYARCVWSLPAPPAPGCRLRQVRQERLRQVQLC